MGKATKRTTRITPPVKRTRAPGAGAHPKSPTIHRTVSAKGKRRNVLHVNLEWTLNPDHAHYLDMTLRQVISIAEVTP